MSTIVTRALLSTVAAGLCLAVVWFARLGSAPVELAPVAVAAVAVEHRAAPAPARRRPPAELRAAARSDAAASASAAPSSPDRSPDLIEVRFEALRASSPASSVALTETDNELQTRLVASYPADSAGVVRLPRSACRSRVDGGVRCVDVPFPSSGAYATLLHDASSCVTVLSPERAPLRLRVLEADGAPLRGVALVDVRVRNATPPADRRHRVEAFGGEAMLDVEATALVLDVCVEALDGRRAPPVQVVGPSVPAREHEVVLRMPPRRALSARLLDEAGRPLRDVAVEVRVAGSSLRLDADARSDEAGRVRVPSPSTAGAATWPLVFVARDADGRERFGELVADLGAAGPSDLGDVWLRAGVTLAAGRCTDAEGRPVAGVALRLQVDEGAAAARQPPFCSAWRDVAHADVRSDADGRFAIVGPGATGQRLRLRAGARRGAPFGAGRDDVAVVLGER